MAESRRPPKKSVRPAATKQVSTRPSEDKARVGAMVKPTDLAALAKSFASLKLKLAESEASLKREKQERSADADTLAEMLVRIVGLEKSLKAAAASDERRRSMGPPVAAIDTEARQRLTAFEQRVQVAETRARTAEARAADAESRTRAAHERLAEVVRDYEAARAAVADADARARNAEDRTAHAEHLAQSAKARATEVTDRFVAMQQELITYETRARAAEARRAEAPVSDHDSLAREVASVRIQLEAAHVALETAREALGLERAQHQRELEQQRERNSRALREAHDTYSEAFSETLEDERARTREEVEQERTQLREAMARIAELEDRVKTAEDRHDAALSDLRRELETLAFDRDAADGQKQLTNIQLRAAEAKLELVDRQLEWAEDSVAIVDEGLGRLGADNLLGAAVQSLVERLGSARAAVFTDSDDDPPQPPPLPGKRA